MTQTTQTTPTTLRAVTLQTVANYTQAAEHAVRAYRVGGQRLIAAMQRGVDRAAAQGPERLAQALRRAGGNVGDLAAKGLDALSSGTERAIEIGSNGFTQQVGRVADLVQGVDNRSVASGLQAVSRASLPGAQVALALSKQVAAVAHKLPGTPVAVVSAKVANVAKVASSSRRRASAQADAVVQQAAATAKKVKQAVAPVVDGVSAAVARAKAARKPATRRASPVVAQAETVAKTVKSTGTRARTRTRRGANAVADAVATAVEAAQA